MSGIKECASRGKTSTFDLARLLCAAKRTLRYGQWTELWRSNAVPFCRRKGYMLVAVGHALGSLDVHDHARLPWAINTLYYLSRLDRAVLLRLISEGTIHPGLTAARAKALLPKTSPEERTRNLSSRLHRRLAKFNEFVSGTLPDWPESDRAFALSPLRVMIREIEPPVPRFLFEPPSATCRH